MFTGLIEQVGVIESITTTSAGIELRIRADYDSLVEGESIAIGGVWFTVAAMVVTVGRSSIGEWLPRQRVNLARAMRADARLGGHMVQGHVDGVGIVERISRQGDALLIDVALPHGLSETLVSHGSVSLDGVSLTVSALERDKLQVALIDYTLQHTSLGGLVEGNKVNVETDVIGKYVQRLVAPYLNR